MIEDDLIFEYGKDKEELLEYFHLRESLEDITQQVIQDTKAIEEKKIQDRNFSHIEYGYFDTNGEEECECCEAGSWMLYDRLYYEMIYDHDWMKWDISDEEVISRYGKTKQEILKHFKLHDE